MAFREQFNQPEGFFSTALDPPVGSGKFQPLSTSTEEKDPRFTHPGRGGRLEKEASFYYTATAISALIPIIAVAIWLGLNSSEYRASGWSSIHSAAIGGHLTQPQAKAIDVLSSALLAPLILALFNYIWFSCARVAVVNEYRAPKAGVPLSALIEASCTTGGTYDLLKLRQLFSARARRLMFLGVLVILSAVSKSALENMIAYEAFTESTDQQISELRLLSDSVLATPEFLTDSFVGIYDYNLGQRATFADQFTGMMTGLSFSNANALLDDKSYILVNATTASMNALPQSIINLREVPGRRWTANCSAWDLSTFSVLQMGEKKVQYNFIGTDGLLMQGAYSGKIETLQDAYNEVYPLLAFGDGAFLGYLTSFNLTNDTYSSPYGDISPVAFNMTPSGFSGTKEVMSAWGIRCSLFQQEGSVDLARAANGTWTVQSSTWSDERKEIPRIRLQDFQVNLNYQAPDVTVAGLGSGLARSANPCYDQILLGDTSCESTTDYETLALNFLYASGETERLAYEIAATNSSRSEPDFFYNVTAVQDILHYRMTYVPVILLVGLASLFSAAVITAGLIYYTYRSYSGQKFRQVDVQRLLVDYMAGLKDKDLQVHDGTRGGSGAGTASNGELDVWSESCRVGYVVDYKDGGEPKICLQHMGPS